MTDVYNERAGRTLLGKHLHRNVEQLCAEALTTTLAQTGMTTEVIEAACFCGAEKRLRAAKRDGAGLGALTSASSEWWS